MNAVGDGFALFDSDDGGAVVLSDFRRRIPFDARLTTLTALEQTFAAMEAALAADEWLAVAMDYALGARFEPSLALADDSSPVLRAWVFGRQQVLDKAGVAAFLAEQQQTFSESQRCAGVAEVQASLDAAAYAAKVGQVQAWIAAGDCYQINLTFPLDFRIYGQPLALYARLRQRQPVRYGALISVPGDEALLSFSPELFFQRTGGRVLARPMKGTAARGVSAAEDEALRRALLASEKERAENIMIVDLLRNDLGRLAAPGGVRVDSLCATEAYPTLWQMVSEISADLPGVRVFDLFRALFPCGSITGAPKIRAMQCISELESRPRGLYTGTVGWLAPGGDGRFNVAIRTLQIAADGRAQLGVGSGIVADSEAGREYAECLLKGRFLTGFDPGFELFETLRLENGEYPLLTHHLERLADSARALGFGGDVAAIARALSEQALKHGQGLFRVRLSLAHAGSHAITVTPLAAEADPAALRAVVLAAELLDADDYLRRHKTTVRGLYDATLAGLAGQPEVFDALFFNARGELCEGARSNVFIERGGRLLTPPVACGVLPGVMRRQLLDSGRAVEAVLRRQDLLGASAIYVANALRGLMPVRLCV
jgi:para-aminobenzoate synthetase/4-amino-4-deoxychorismate lyase